LVHEPRRNGHVLLLAARVGEAQVREFRLFFFYEFQYVTGCHIASGKGVELAAGVQTTCVRGWRSGLVLQGPCQAITTANQAVRQRMARGLHYIGASSADYCTIRARVAAA